MRYLFIRLLAGCVTEKELSGAAQQDHSSLKCVGYCDVVMTDKNREIDARGKVQLKHGSDDIEDEDDE